MPVKWAESMLRYDESVVGSVALVLKLLRLAEPFLGVCCSAALGAGVARLIYNRLQLLEIVAEIALRPVAESLLGEFLRERFWLRHKIHGTNETVPS